MEYTMNPDRAKSRFIGLYILSLILIFVVVSSFWQRRVEDVRQTRVEESIRVADNGSADLDNLRKSIAEKDQKIATLENQLKAAPASSTANVASMGADEKDKMIASLQTQLKEKEAELRTANSNASVSSTGSGDSEWKQKYASLKASYDKVAANEKALKTAYKTVTDDNQRLLTQLMKKN
jgi:phage-related protein